MYFANDFIRGIVRFFFYTVVNNSLTSAIGARNK